MYSWNFAGSFTVTLAIMSALIFLSFQTRLMARWPRTGFAIRSSRAGNGVVVLLGIR